MEPSRSISIIIRALSLEALSTCPVPTMAPPYSPDIPRSDSPDPFSHAANVYDAAGAEGEWLGETENDDDTFEPTTDESESTEFFDPSEDVEADFHGTALLFSKM